MATYRLNAPTYEHILTSKGLVHGGQTVELDANEVFHPLLVLVDEQADPAEPVSESGDQEKETQEETQIAPEPFSSSRQRG